jgi:tRNA pseudouridine38-40 synthase
MRFAIGLEYDGSGFLGWQVQRNEPTVQSCVQKALSSIANHDVPVTCSGRTDTGVHALCQVAHFDSDADRTERSWLLGANTLLPDQISLLWIRPVDETFHARFSAHARRYRYLILNRPIRPALGHGRFSWVRERLDQSLMDQGASALLGEHDFSAFRAASCQARHAVREVHEISVHRQGDLVVLDVVANGFLYHMVRNIAGSLLSVGKGERPPGWMKELLAARDRTLAAPTASPDGLYFVGARYPAAYNLPIETREHWPQIIV